MKKSRSVLVVLPVMIAASMTTGDSRAATVDLDLGGQGVSASLVLTYGMATDAKYPGAFEVTGIGGTFSDSNNGLHLVDVDAGAPVAITHDVPEASNLLAPHDFSRFAVASGLGPDNNGFLTYDNLFYPLGSPQTATAYPPHGGPLDIYGLMFDIGGGTIVNVWSNGAGANGLVDYGVAVATADAAIDYVSGGVSAVPEPESFWLLCIGLAGALCRHRRGSAGRGPGPRTAMSG